MVTVGQHVFNSIVLLIHNFLSANVPSETRFQDVHPEEGLDFRSQIKHHGYLFEEHEVQTADGYLLTLFRIISPKFNKTFNLKESKGKGVPILMVHGFLSSAQDYILMGPNVSMAYGLVDSGYDVWLGNCRGNTWSRNHIKYSPEKPDFWKFSFHEIGYYDLPAKIDHITSITGHESVYYIGHSQGTTAMFIMASERPEYVNKVRLFVALAPVAYARKMPSLFMSILGLFYKPVEWLFYTFDYVEFFPHAKITTEALRLLSRPTSPFVSFSLAMLYSNLGYSEDTDPKLYPFIAGSFPAGSSTRQLLHFIQSKNSDSFRKFDHGPAMNKRIYGQFQPPKYNMRTKIPTALIYSRNDWLSTEYDVQRIQSNQKNIKLTYQLPGSYSHADFIFGKETNKILFDLLQKLFQKY